MSNFFVEADFGPSIDQRMSSGRRTWSTDEQKLIPSEGPWMSASPKKTPGVISPAVFS
jgi:hypothetical protein